MSLTAQVVNGKLVQQTDKTEAESNGKKNAAGGALDKDAFLQLLVAEMKYQNPMEASNNSTEYISQLATFSELESMQNLQDTAEDMKMSQMVGKNVILNVNDQLIAGQVDRLQYEAGETKLVVNDACYSMEDVYQIIDDDYYTATTKVQTILATVVKLPELANATTADLKQFGEIAETYEGMTDYEKTFLTGEEIEFIEGYLEAYEAYLESLEVDPMEVLIQKMDSYGLRMSDLLQQIIDKEPTVIVTGTESADGENTDAAGDENGEEGTEGASDGTASEEATGGSDTTVE